MFDWLKNLFGSKQADEVTLPPPPPPSAPRPLVGISGSDCHSKSVVAMVAQIRAAGAEPIFLGEHDERLNKNGGAGKAATADLNKLDALVVLGNDNDIDPAKYGQAKHARTQIETNLPRAAYEEAIIAQALERKIPLVAVCGGMQRLNVLGGGTLHQHVPDVVGDNHHMQTEAPFVPVQFVTIDKNSKLAAIADGVAGVYTPKHGALPPGVIMENSFHHQAVNVVRPDFTVSARSDDGIIEAIEPKAGSPYSDQFVVGVQWHPEFGASEIGPKLAGALTSAAKEYASNKETTAPLISEEPKEIRGPASAAILARRQQLAMGR